MRDHKRQRKSGHKRGAGSRRASVRAGWAEPQVGVNLSREIAAAKRHLEWLKKQQPTFRAAKAKKACAASMKVVEGQIARLKARGAKST